MGRLLTIIGAFLLLFFAVRTFTQQAQCVSKNMLRLYRAEIERLKAECAYELKRFNRSSLADEVCLQALLRLIDCELELADALIDNKSGLCVQRCEEKRNLMVSQMAPSIVRIYNMVLDHATAESMYVCKMRDWLNQQRRTWTVLYEDAQHHFLESMVGILDPYYATLTKQTI